MLRWRMLLGTAIIGALVGLCWLDARTIVPGIWLLPFVLVIGVLATKETLDLLAAVGMRPMPWLVQLVNLASVLSVWLGACNRLLGIPLSLWVFQVALYVLPVLAIFVAEMSRYRRPGGNSANIAGAIFAWIYVGWMLMFAVQLRLDGGIEALVAWIVAVKMGDTGAYIVGRSIGRHKMAPLLSPGKTIEGAVGALAFSCLGSWTVLKWLLPVPIPGPEYGWIVFGLLLGAAGMVGDLAESLLKRDGGRKDSSDWLPGFGGVLDIIDSLLLSAPVAWLCWAAGLIGR